VNNIDSFWTKRLLALLLAVGCSSDDPSKAEPWVYADTGASSFDTDGGSDPVISSVAITPSTDIDTSTTLTCTASAHDADGDALSITYEWTIADTGDALGSDGSLTLSPSSTSPGDIIVCTATVTDPDDGRDSLTADVTVDNTDHEVVIVGAGASGLYAAYVLKGLGYDVSIIEASDHHGGRVRALEGFADFPVELGAEDVEGSGNRGGAEPSFLYADIVDFDPDRLQESWTYEADQDALYGLDGSTVWDSEARDPDIREVWQFYNQIGRYDGEDVFISDFLRDEYDIDSDHRTYHFYEGYIGASYGTSISRMGMRSLAIEWNLWLTGGRTFTFDRASYLETLTELYFAEVLEDVVYSSPVVAVDYSGTRPVAMDAHGMRHNADAVLVTVSLGVLKSGMIDFDPALPADKVAAIETIGMGNGMKIILRFDEAFWDTDRMYELLNEGPTQECWTPGKLKTDGTDNVLTCFIMGESAEFMASLGENGAVDQALGELDAIFENQATAHFEAAYVQDWTAEPYILGSYSYPAPDTFPEGYVIGSGESMRDKLAAPVDDRLFFAGEATHNRHPSTVHGALETGRRAAAEIAAVLGG
jgi:monoamine oxidase